MKELKSIKAVAVGNCAVFRTNETRANNDFVILALALVWEQKERLSQRQDVCMRMEKQAVQGRSPSFILHRIVCLFVLRQHLTVVPRLA